MKMTEQDKSRFSQALSYLSTAFDRQPLDASKKGVWFDALAGKLTVDQVEFAVKQAAGTLAKFPVPQQIIEIGRMMSQPNRIEYKPPTEPTSFGKAAAKLLATFTDPDSGMSHRDYLLEVGRLAETHNKSELQQWVMGRWDVIA